MARARVEQAGSATSLRSYNLQMRAARDRTCLHNFGPQSWCEFLAHGQRDNRCSFAGIRWVLKITGSDLGVGGISWIRIELVGSTSRDVGVRDSEVKSSAQSVPREGNASRTLRGRGSISQLKKVTPEAEGLGPSRTDEVHTFLHHPGYRSRGSAIRIGAREIRVGGRMREDRLWDCQMIVEGKEKFTELTPTQSSEHLTDEWWIQVGVHSLDRARLASGRSQKKNRAKRESFKIWLDPESNGLAWKYIERRLCAPCATKPSFGAFIPRYEDNIPRQRFQGADSLGGRRQRYQLD
ncbi:hypothetical protein DFH09DRAFT_1086909 [Mycena vulgaris]|nr:hypothetical protein DFH09DRAFT_1086909 [Mycena vulgaris]